MRLGPRTKPSQLLLAAVAVVQLLAMPIVQACARAASQGATLPHAAMADHSVEHAAMRDQQLPACSVDESSSQCETPAHGDDCIFMQGCLSAAVPAPPAGSAVLPGTTPELVNAAFTLASIDRAPDTPPPRA